MLPISMTATMMIHPRWNFYSTTLPYRLYCLRMVVDFAAVVGFVTLAIVVLALAIVEVAAAAAAAHQSTVAAKTTLLPPLLAPLRFHPGQWYYLRYLPIAAVVVADHR